MVEYTPVIHDNKQAVTAWRLTMDILGVLLIFIMPYLAGYVCKEITRQKEMSQIETYLTGFFLLFLVQGLVFGAGVFAGRDFETACRFMNGAQGLIVVLFLVFGAIRLMPAHRGHIKREPFRKEEKILLGITLFLFALVLAKIFYSTEALRDDAVLETVRTTLSTGTMFQYQPLTGQKMELGMIISKKIITLPLYDAYLVNLTGIEPSVLLYDVLTVQTLVAVYLSTLLLVSRIYEKARRKSILFAMFLGMLLLSGDYFKETLSYHIVYNGYLGMTICMAVILPYLLFLLYSWYMEENREQAVSWKRRALYFFKIVLCFLTSIFITGIATGFLFLFLTLVVAGVCCLVITLMEVHACRES